MKSFFSIEVRGGEMPEVHKSIFREEWQKLSDGWYNVGFEYLSGYFKKTRYKYYFDCVLGFALPSASQVYQLIENGQPRFVRNTKELHQVCKVLFNPVVIINAKTGQTITRASSTTQLSDRKFISQYLQEVMAHFAQPPFNVEYVNYEEWKELHEQKKWHQIKYKATSKNTDKDIY